MAGYYTQDIDYCPSSKTHNTISCHQQLWGSKLILRFIRLKIALELENSPFRLLLQSQVYCAFTSHSVTTALSWKGLLTNLGPSELMLSTIADVFLIF